MNESEAEASSDPQVERRGSMNRSRHPRQDVVEGKSEVVQVEDRHVEVLAEFFRRVWDPDATPDGVRAARAAAAASNPLASGTPPPRFLFLSGGEAIGHVGTIPTTFWMDGEAVPVHWVKGLMVLPAHRNGPVGFLVLKEAARTLGSLAATVVQPAPRRLFEALGFRDLGTIPNFLRLLRPTALLERVDPGAVDLPGVPALATTALGLARRLRLTKLLGASASLALGAWAGTVGRVASGLEIRVLDEVDPDECDALWRRARRQIRAAAVRDATAFAGRFVHGQRYQLAGVYGGDVLRGLCTVRSPKPQGEPRLAGLKVAVLSDLLFAPDDVDAGVATIAAAEGLAQRADSDALLCSAAHKALTPLLRRRAFKEIPGNLHLLVRPGEEAPAFCDRLDEWWATRADGQADEAF